MCSLRFTRQVLSTVWSRSIPVWAVPLRLPPKRQDIRSPRLRQRLHSATRSMRSKMPSQARHMQVLSRHLTTVLSRCQDFRLTSLSPQKERSRHRWKRRERSWASAPTLRGRSWRQSARSNSMWTALEVMIFQRLTGRRCWGVCRRSMTSASMSLQRRSEKA